MYTQSAATAIGRGSALPVPDNLTIKSLTASRTDDRFFLGLEGFLTPPSLWLGDAGDGSFALAKSQKPQFDASSDVVEQFEATSKDGTKVPYFVVHRKDMRYDGSNPTLLTAYGGFQIANTPSYSPVNGKLWLEHGGVFVLANIRGGGEFGPAWHEAGLKTHRQRIYDDFYAVAQDLVTRKITSSRRLGIIGGSNGGLLMGVEFTQHPEMWNAVVIQVPLLDMLAFEHLSAGASWVGEYGSVSVPEERAFLASISPYNQLKPDVQLSGAADLYHHQGRSRRPGSCAQVCCAPGGISQAVLLRRDHRGRTRRRRRQEAGSKDRRRVLHLSDDEADGFNWCWTA